MIDVVIVNWNSGEYLQSCLRSLNANVHVIIVDNCSDDGSADCALEFSNVTLLRQSENVGFGAACNIGAAYSNADLILFLNPDAAVFPETLSRLVAYMYDPENSQIGICGVQLVDEYGRVARHCSRFPTASGFFFQAVGVDRVRPSWGRVMAEWDHLTSRGVDQVIGAFFAVRREVYELLGGFDERFFVYYEEVDFSYRALCAGWETSYFAGTRAMHAGNGSTRNVKAERLFYSWRSRLLYVVAHFAWHKALIVFLVTCFIEPISRSIFSIFRCSWSGLKETWTAYVMLFCWIPNAVLERKTSDHEFKS